jgi:hypothetical protein
MRGYSSTMPLFYFNFEPVSYQPKAPSFEDVVAFMKLVIDNMQLATECILISLIYLEKLMSTSKIEIRNINWKPLLFTAILLASKFWEDVNFWNVDYEDQLGIYALKSINRMESEFISLCNYNIYVSAHKYNQYLAYITQMSRQPQPGLLFEDQQHPL